MRAYLFVAVLLLLIFGGMAGFLFNKFSAFSSADFSLPPVVVAAATAREDIWETELEAVGTLGAARGVQLSAETAVKSLKSTSSPVTRWKPVTCCSH